MAVDILGHYQHVIESFVFITGSKGVFDVWVNGELIFSKHELGRHAQPGEVFEKFKAFIGPEVEPYPQG